MYGKLIDGALEVAPKNYTTENNTILNFNLDEDLMREYGYKPVIESEKPDYPYTVSYEEDENEIREIITPDIEQAKQDKIDYNDDLRDTALNGGVTYQNVLFDSDTDQKVNLLATVSTMSDMDTITWYGMDNQGLLCTKGDLIAIGGLITELHSFCWQNNAYIKEQIEQAKTIEELDEIEISYDRDDTLENELSDEEQLEL